MIEIKKQLTQVMQFRNFKKWMKLHKGLSLGAKWMWHIILVQYNELHWPDSVPISNNEMRELMSLEDKNSDIQHFNRYRRELVKAGLIHYSPGRRGKSPIYTTNFLIDVGQDVEIMSKQDALAYESQTELQHSLEQSSEQSSNGVMNGVETGSRYGIDNIIHSAEKPHQNQLNQESELCNKTNSETELKTESQQSLERSCEQSSDRVVNGVATSPIIRARENENKNENKNENENIIYTQTYTNTQTTKSVTSVSEPVGWETSTLEDTPAEPTSETHNPNQPTDQPVSTIKAVDAELTGSDATEQMSLGLEVTASKPKVKSTAKKTLDDGKCEEFRVFYNNHRGGMVKCLKINQRRKSLLNARVKEYDEDTVRNVIVAAGKNDFYGGGGSRGWRADLEWILTSRNFDKIYERDLDSGPVSTQDFFDLAARAYTRGSEFDTTGNTAAYQQTADQLSGEFFDYSVE